MESAGAGRLSDRLRARADRAEATLDETLALDNPIVQAAYSTHRIERIRAAIRLDREAANRIEELGG